MLRKLLAVLKKISFGFIILYGFNFILASTTDIFIPINVITIGTVSGLGFPGLFSLVAVFFLTK